MLDLSTNQEFVYPPFWKEQSELVDELLVRFDVKNRTEKEFKYMISIHLVFKLTERIFNLNNEPEEKLTKQDRLISDLVSNFNLYPLDKNNENERLKFLAGFISFQYNKMKETLKPMDFHYIKVLFTDWETLKNQAL